MEQISQTSNLLWTLICIVGAITTVVASHVSLKGDLKTMQKSIEDLNERKKSEIKRLEDQHERDIRKLEEADKLLAEADKEIITLMNSRFDTVQTGIYKMVESLGELKGELRSKA